MELVCGCFGVGRGCTAFGDEDQCGGVHTISLAGGSGAVVKYVAEMGAGFAVYHFPAGHTVATVHDETDGIRVDGGVEAGPAGAAVKFSVRVEDRLQGGRRIVGAFLKEMIVFAGACSFGTRLPEDIVLGGSEPRFPLGVSEGHRVFGVRRSLGRIGIFGRLGCRGQRIEEEKRG